MYDRFVQGCLQTLVHFGLYGSGKLLNRCYFWDVSDESVCLCKWFKLLKFQQQTLFLFDD